MIEKKAGSVREGFGQGVEQKRTNIEPPESIDFEMLPNEKSHRSAIGLII